MAGKDCDEAVYAQVLGAMRGLIEEWAGFGVTADVHGDAVLWTSLRLPADYRTAKKATKPFWADTMRYERRCSSEYGYFVLYHNT